MGLTVKQRGQNVATFRVIEGRLMEVLSAWVRPDPTATAAPPGIDPRPRAWCRVAGVARCDCRAL